MVPSIRNTSYITIVRGIYRVQRVFNDQAAAESARFGLHVSDLDVIHTLGNTEGIRIGALAQYMLTSAANATRITKKLEARGLVQRRRSETSDREVIVRLTKQGEAIFEASYPEIGATVKRYVDETLTPSEQDVLIRLLSKLAPTA